MVGRGVELEGTTLSTLTAEDDGGGATLEEAGALLSGAGAGDEGTGEGV